MNFGVPDIRRNKFTANYKNIWLLICNSLYLLVCYVDKLFKK